VLKHDVQHVEDAAHRPVRQQFRLLVRLAAWVRLAPQLREESRRLADADALDASASECGADVRVPPLAVDLQRPLTALASRDLAFDFDSRDR
jgi:hypothetical protein